MVCAEYETFLGGRRIHYTCLSEFVKGVHAQIVWCKPLNKGFYPRYGVGVKYFEPLESQID
jgi:hypothetical protein